MEISRRIGIPKTTVYRTISKVKAEVSVREKRGSEKSRVINKKDTIPLVKLARNNIHVSY